MQLTSQELARHREISRRFRQQAMDEMGWSEAEAAGRGVSPSGVTALRSLAECLDNAQTNGLTEAELRERGFLDSLFSWLPELTIPELVTQDENERWCITELGRQALPYLDT